MAAPLSRRKGNRKPASALSFSSSSGRTHGSFAKTLVKALAFSACVQPGTAWLSLRGQVAPVPEVLKPGLLNNLVSARQAQLPTFKASSTRARSYLAALNAQVKRRPEMTSTKDETYKKIRKTFASPLKRLQFRRQKGEREGLEKQLRDFLFTKARFFCVAGDLTTLYGFIPILTQLLVLSEDFDCMMLSNDPTLAVPAGLALLSRTVQLQFFSVVLLGVSLSQLVVGTRETLKAQNLFFGRDPFCFDLWFPLGINAQPGGARITFRRKDEPNAKPMAVKNLFELLRLPTKSEEQRRQLQFFFTFRGKTVALSEETADILVFGTTSTFIAIVGAFAPFLAYVGVGVRDAHLGGTDLSELAQLNLRLATSQVSIAAIGVTFFVSSLIRASPEVRSEFKDKKKAGVLSAETIKLVEDLKMPQLIPKKAKAVLPSILALPILLAFLGGGFGRAPTIEVTRKACNAAKNVGTQVKGISVAKMQAASFGVKDMAKLQTNFDFDAKGTPG
eukprot:gnl/MRDRNA2_/MRDRNA2_92741_c0_seq1.p1 gnl/MRDRNA2_/MRDRNA2_92741_c0~~gnl/MRDRNA2_/MRDRNA2_92741_c0_seq1.p1  ORF type:complete len:504 (-),score=69.92 gnl/MRDRNA2_/MRDRNA2_92741_c0_seq1:591-2102(-)